MILKGHRKKRILYRTSSNIPERISNLHRRNHCLKFSGFMFVLFCTLSELETKMHRSRKLSSGISTEICMLIGTFRLGANSATRFGGILSKIDLRLKELVFRQVMERNQ